MRATTDQASPVVGVGRVLLILFGLALTLFGSRSVQPTHSQGEVLVWVNQQPVTSGQMTFAVERLAGGRPGSLSEAQRQSILELMIDEELLLQRAQSLGIYGTDPSVRKAIVQAAIDRVVENFLAQTVDSKHLKLFYHQHEAVFERPPRVAVEVLQFDNLAEAEQARAALLSAAGLAKVSRRANSGALARLPSSPLPAHVLRRYLGPGLTDIALNLEQGEVSDPVERYDGVYLVKASQVMPAEVPDFEEVREEVEAEYRHRGREAALEQTLVELWRTADIDLHQQETSGLEMIGKDPRGLLQNFENNADSRGSY